MTMTPAPPCPGCQSGVVVVRTAKATGAKFLGCSRFPECRWTGKHEEPARPADPQGQEPETPPMLPARPINCPNPCLQAQPEPGATPAQVAACFRKLLELMFAEGCQERKVGEVMSRLRCQFNRATMESLRMASKQPTVRRQP